MFGLHSEIQRVIEHYKARWPGTPEQFQHIIDELTMSAADFIGRRLAKSSKKALEEERKMRERFVRRNERRWRKGLEQLELLMITSREVGSLYFERYGRDIEKKQDHKMWVLVRLHARACHVASEVIALMLSGYADGALTRWRALHEIAVTAAFLAGETPETSERYLAHEFVESHRAAEEYQKYCQKLGYKKLSKREIARIDKTRNAFVSRFGDDFRHPYGWAAQVFGQKRVTLSEIEAKVGLEHMRPWYRMASHSIHAGPHGLHSTLGLSEAKDEFWLVGPSNGGLADPGHATANSLFQVTKSLLHLNATTDEKVSLILMERMVNTIGTELMKSHRMKGLAKRRSKSLGTRKSKRRE